MDPFTDEINRERALSRRSLRSREGERKVSLLTQASQASPGQSRLWRGQFRFAGKNGCALKSGEPADRCSKQRSPSTVRRPPRRAVEPALAPLDPLNAERAAARLRAENPFYAVKSQNPGHAFNALFHSLSKKRERLTQNRSRILELIFRSFRRRENR